MILIWHWKPLWVFRLRWGWRHLLFWLSLLDFQAGRHTLPDHCYWLTNDGTSTCSWNSLQCLSVFGLDGWCRKQSVHGPVTEVPFVDSSATFFSASLASLGMIWRTASIVVASLYKWSRYLVLWAHCVKVSKQSTTSSAWVGLYTQGPPFNMQRAIHWQDVSGLVPFGFAALYSIAGDIVRVWPTKKFGSKHKCSHTWSIQIGANLLPGGFTCTLRKLTVSLMNEFHI